MKNFWGILALFLCAPWAQAQFIGASALFRPGLRLGAAYQPATDSAGLGMAQARMSLIVPIGGKTEFKLSELKASTAQHFLSMGASWRQIEGDMLPKAQQTPQFGLGIAGVKAGLLTGIVAYGAYAGVINHAQGNVFFAGAGAVKVQVKGLNKQNFYGFALIYGGKKVFPLPILGIRRKIADKTFVTVLLPAQIDVTRNLGKGSQLVAMASLDGFRTYISPQRMQNDLKLNFSRLKCGLTFNWRLNRNIRILAEGGINAWSQVQIEGERFSWKGNPAPTPYANVGLRMNLGNSLISTQLFGMDL
jgi:hypothetical protein